MNVLLIEDNDLARRAIRVTLERAGCAVTCAEDGRRGLAAFQKSRPDLVITDIIMPEKEGFETIRAMRSVWPDGPIIAISGGGRIGDADLLQMARLLGADAALQKPFEGDELLALMRACLERQRAPAATDRKTVRATKSAANF